MLSNNQLSIFKTNKKYPTLEDILNEFSNSMKKGNPSGDNLFGYWMQTLADLQLLDLELSGLTSNYQIDSINRKVEFDNNKEKIINQIAHLDYIGKEQTQYSYLTDLFGDTNAYAFHNLYPYKGKFYPRIVRTLINTFNLKKSDLILDPFNGCGTTTHECSLMGFKSIGIDINPIGNIIAKLKNELIFVDEKLFDLKDSELIKIFEILRTKKRTLKNQIIYELFMLIYFDTIDAFVRTSRYNKKGQIGLFVEKFKYIKDCYTKTKRFIKEWKIEPIKAEIREGNVLQLDLEDESIDVIITSPPYYFSLDYVGKDKIAYDYLNSVNYFNYNMNNVKNEYLGMKINENVKTKKSLDKKIITYFEDLKTSILEMIRVLKRNGKFAIVIGDSTVDGKKLPTTDFTQKFILENGLKHIRSVFNPLLGARNRAIRGESILLYTKE